MKKTNENTKVTLTFGQLRRLVKEANTYRPPKRQYTTDNGEFESEELYNIYPNDDDLHELLYSCEPTKFYDVDEQDVVTSSFVQEQYDTLIEMVKLLGSSKNQNLKNVAKEIQDWMTPHYEAFKKYIADEPARQKANDALKQKRREQYLKLRDEFKDEEI